MPILMWSGKQTTLPLTGFTSKAESEREKDSKCVWKYFLVLLLACSVTGALSAAECQVVKRVMNRFELKVRDEKKVKQAKKKSPNSTHLE